MGYLILYMLQSHELFAASSFVTRMHLSAGNVQPLPWYWSIRSFTRFAWPASGLIGHEAPDPEKKESYDGNNRSEFHEKRRSGGVWLSRPRRPGRPSCTSAKADDGGSRNR